MENHDGNQNQAAVPASRDSVDATVRLLPCPFCGSDKIELNVEDVGRYAPVIEYEYFCMDCGSIAAHGIPSSEESARQAWNRRPNKEAHQTSQSEV